MTGNEAPDYLSPAELAAETLLSGRPYERRMPPHIVPEVEGLLSAVRNKKVADALRMRTQRASSETTQLIQMGIFSPDFAMHAIPVIDRQGRKIENPKPYQVWEATKEMRTVMSAVISGLMTDHMEAVVNRKKAYIMIPAHREIAQFGREINAVTIEARFFRGFGKFETVDGKAFTPRESTSTVSPGGEYAEQVEQIITSNFMICEHFALQDVLGAIRSLNKRHPLQIMNNNLKTMVEYGLMHGLIERPNRTDPVFQFIAGGLGTQSRNLAALADLIPKLAKNQNISLSPDAFVAAFMNSVPLLRLFANEDLSFLNGATDVLKFSLSPAEDALEKQQKKRGRVLKGEKRPYEKFSSGHFSLEGTGDKLHVALLHGKDRIGYAAFAHGESNARRRLFHVMENHERFRRGSPRVIARCPARQQRYGGKDDVITATHNLLGQRLYTLNALYRAKKLTE